MSKLTNTCSWHENIYDELLHAKRSGMYMAANAHQTGKVVQVEKKYDENDKPFIEYIIQTED
jgi:hypothetical protein